MATTKQKADVKAVRKANETALKRFPKSRLVKAFGAMAEANAAAEGATETKAAAALDVVDAACQFRSDNPEATTEAVLTGLRDHLKLVAMELALAGNKFAELTEAKDDKPATAKLTGYGANVVSIAKGAVEFDLGPSALAGSGLVDGEVSYRDVRKLVEAKRAEAKRQSDPDAALLADAKAEAIEAWDELRKAVFETGDVGLVDGLRQLMVDGLAEFKAAAAEQDAIEAEAEAA